MLHCWNYNVDMNRNKQLFKQFWGSRILTELKSVPWSTKKALNLNRNITFQVSIDIIRRKEIDRATWRHIKTIHRLQIQMNTTFFCEKTDEYSNSISITSSWKGIAGPPLMFLGFNRGSNNSKKAFPPELLKLKKISISLFCMVSSPMPVGSNHKHTNWPVIVEYKDTFMHSNCSQWTKIE
jgi:hypothetical protein